MGKLFTKGDKLTRIDALCAELADHRWVYIDDRPRHPAFVISMELRTVLGMLDHGRFSTALPRRKEVKDGEQNTDNTS